MMLYQIVNEQPFQVLSDSFTISPSESGYDLYISADGVNYTNFATVAANTTRQFTGMNAGNYYRLMGNTSTVTVNWERDCRGGGGGGVAGVSSIDGQTGALTTKTINGNSILGSGDIVISGGSAGEQNYVIVENLSGITNPVEGMVAYQSVSSTTIVSGETLNGLYAVADFDGEQDSAFYVGGWNDDPEDTSWIGLSYNGGGWNTDGWILYEGDGQLHTQEEYTQFGTFQYRANENRFEIYPEYENFEFDTYEVNISESGATAYTPTTATTVFPGFYQYQSGEWKNIDNLYVAVDALSAVTNPVKGMLANLMNDTYSPSQSYPGFAVRATEPQEGASASTTIEYYYEAEDWTLRAIWGDPYQYGYNAWWVALNDDNWFEPDPNPYDWAFFTEIGSNTIYYKCNSGDIQIEFACSAGDMQNAVVTDESAYWTFDAEVAPSQLINRAGLYVYNNDYWGEIPVCPADEYTLGGIMIGEGLEKDEEGRTKVIFPTQNYRIAQSFDELDGADEGQVAYIRREGTIYNGKAVEADENSDAIMRYGYDGGEWRYIIFKHTAGGSWNYYLSNWEEQSSDPTALTYSEEWSAITIDDKDFIYMGGGTGLTLSAVCLSESVWGPGCENMTSEQDIIYETDPEEPSAFYQYLRQKGTYDYEWQKLGIPTASQDTLGGIKVGSGLTIDGNGVLSLSQEVLQALGLI